MEMGIMGETLEECFSKNGDPGDPKIFQRAWHPSESAPFDPDIDVSNCCPCTCDSSLGRPGGNREAPLPF